MPSPYAGLLGETGGTRNVSASVAELARLADAQTEPDNPLYNVGKFLSRPLYAVTSALSGRFGDAGENLLQMAMDLPTGGFLNRDWSLANLVDETGDITTRKERPEFTDLMSRWGFGRPTSSLGRLALDVGGGMALDPLTYLSFGTSGLAKGALSGVSREGALGRLGYALGKTPAGRKALREAEDTLVSRWKAVGAAHPIPGPEVTREIATENVLLNSMRRQGTYTDDLARLTGHVDQGDALNAGMRSLVAEGLMDPAQGVKIGLPLTEGVLVPGSDRFPRIREFTAPWLAKRLLSKVSPTAGELAGEFAEEGARKLAGTLFDKTLLFKVNEGARRLVTRLSLNQGGDAVEAKDLVRKLWGSFEPEQRETIKEAWDLAGEAAENYRGKLLNRSRKIKGTWRGSVGGDRVAKFVPDPRDVPLLANKQKTIVLADLKALDELWKKDAAYYVGKTSTQEGKREIVNAFVDTADEIYMPRIGGVEADGTLDVVDGRHRLAALRDRGAAKVPVVVPADEATGLIVHLDRQAEKAGLTPPPGYTDDMLRDASTGEVKERALQAAMREKAMGEIMAAHPEIDRAALERSLSTYDASMERMLDELVQLGIMTKQEAKGFYVPHQAVPVISELMSQAHGDSALTESLRLFFKDNFTRARKNLNVDEFRDALTKWAEENGHGDLIERLGDTLDERDIGALHLQRLLAHSKTVKHRTMWNEAKKRFIPKGQKRIPQNVARYLNAQLGELGMRRNALQTFLGGGEYKVPLANMSKELLDLAEKKKWKVKDGFVHVKWNGINRVYKPFLTTNPLNVGFHFRNTLASFIMGFTDPDIGWKGTSGLLNALQEYPLVRRLPWQKNEVGVALAAMRGDDAAMAALAGKKFGTHSAKQVVSDLRKIVGERISQSDLMAEIGVKNALGEVVPETRWQKVSRYGEDWADRIESSFRANAYLALLEKGVPPTEAMKRVGKAFVEYNLNSEVERAIRDTFPFARFAIGSTAWLKPYAQVPRRVNWIARMQQSQQGEGDILPESVRGGIGIPYGKDREGNERYVTSFGLPQEPSFAMLDMVTSAEGLRRSGLGAMHPLLKFPLEQATDSSFFFGGKAGQYRRAPWYTLPFAKEIETPTGIRKEVPGWVNDLAGATPVSRFLKIPEVAIDQRKDVLDKVIRLTTGVRTVTSDQRRALAEALKRRLQPEIDAGNVWETSAFISRLGDKTPEELKALLSGMRAVRSKKNKKPKSVLEALQGKKRKRKKRRQ